MRIVDECEHRPTLRRNREKAQCPNGDREGIARSRCCETEGCRKRFGLGGRNGVEVVDQRLKELGQPREGELGFGLDPARSQHETFRGSTGGVFEKRRLANSRLARQEKNFA
ncbi:MAG TPA: hypothetical protein VJU01_08080 [Gaiellaceae bacterium]|nr:hypothetical protein [Gaiellaceae bacterium]